MFYRVEGRGLPDLWWVGSVYASCAARLTAVQSMRHRDRERGRERERGLKGFRVKG